MKLPCSVQVCTLGGDVHFGFTLCLAVHHNNHIQKFRCLMLGEKSILDFYFENNP